MKMEKAITTLTTWTEKGFYLDRNELKEAAGLGTEALKWIKDNRVGMAGHIVKQLPGETTD